MGTSRTRKFFTILLPGAKYGLLSAALVTFTLVMTDFGHPKVGGNFKTLQTLFRLVIGQRVRQGSVVALLLLLPRYYSLSRWIITSAAARRRYSPRCATSPRQARVSTV